MCGRYAMPMDAHALQQALNQQYNIPEPEVRGNLPAYTGYNVAPTRSAPVYSTTEDQPNIEWMSWGLIPFWAKDHNPKDQYKTFNARVESVLDGSRMWKSVRGTGYRCVVPVMGYYEWMHKPVGQGKKVDKIPYYIRRKDQKLMFMAGMCTHVKFDDKEFGTFTMVTSPAPSDMKWVHNRMPVVLEPGTKAWDRWLSDEEWSDELGKECLQPYEGCGEKLEWFEVSRDVGKVQNEGDYLIKPVKKGGITSQLGRAKKEFEDNDIKTEGGPDDFSKAKRMKDESGSESKDDEDYKSDTKDQSTPETNDEGSSGAETSASSSGVKKETKSQPAKGKRDISHFFKKRSEESIADRVHQEPTKKPKLE